MEPTGSPDDELAILAADAEMLSMFVGEALDHLGTIESVVLQLEGAPADVKLLNDVFRPFHTVKGNAGALGVTSVQEFAHCVESLLDLARAGKHLMGPDEFDIVLRAVDLLTIMMQELPDRVATGRSSSVTTRRDALMFAVEAMIAGGSSAATAAIVDAEAVETPTAASEAGPPPAPTAPARTACSAAAPPRARSEAQSTVKVDTSKLDNLIDMVGELVIAQSILAADPAFAKSVDERLGRRMAQLKRITSDLQRNAMSMRMVPIRQVFQKMARLVRDLSKQSGKNIELVLQGEDTELDRKVVEDINDPLMHMVRNSVDHGIESPERRAAAGKPAQATLRLRAAHVGGNIVIEIADDGAGLDTDRIYAKAVSNGLIAPGAQLAPGDIHQMIFQPGFSTAEKVTEISGRGVGMDVVRRNIEALRGRIEIQTARGQGTTFSIRLPLTLAIVDGILVAVGHQRFVIPACAVRESLRPKAEQIHSVYGQACLVQVRDRLIPSLHLGDLFGIAGAQPDVTNATVVVLEDNGRPTALIVDELIGRQEVVIKSLGSTFEGVRGVAGGAILGDGRVGLILDDGGLAGLIGKGAAHLAA